MKQEHVEPWDNKSSDVDPMIRFKKKIPGGGWKAVLTCFLAICILVPIWLCILLPLAIFASIKRCICKPKRSTAVPLDLPSIDESKIIPLEKRKFDVVVFGATGFTGQLVANYYATHYQELNWAIAGRREEALIKIRDDLAKIDPKLKELPIIIADSGKLETIADMVADTRVIVTTAGPFARYGSGVVALCAHYGTSYCDITGETNWVREMVYRYDDVARKTGARIVPFCGNDCIPWDISTYMVAQKLKEAGEDVKEFYCYDLVKGAASGGTIETLFHSLENPPPKLDSKFDPLVTAPDGTKSESYLTAYTPKFLSYSKEMKSWVWTWVMAMVMGNCVRRSNAVNGYGAKVLYTEYMCFPSFSAGLTYYLGNIVFGTALVNSLSAAALRKFLPKPGMGPTKTQMDAGYLKVTTIGKGTKGSKVTATIFFSSDPGYGATACMLAESGLALSKDADDINVGGGVWTPGSCLKETLLRRLVLNNVAEFNISNVEK